MTDLERILIETCSYSVSFDGKAFFCRFCGLSSFHPLDVENRYCGKCKVWHDNLKLEEYLLSLSVQGAPEVKRRQPSGRRRSGQARMASMTPEERVEMARRGGRARWAAKNGSANPEVKEEKEPGS